MATTEQLIKRLKSWCDKERGRRTALAKTLGVTPQVITNWLNGRQNPTGDQTLLVLKFLKEKQLNLDVD